MKYAFRILFPLLVAMPALAELTVITGPTPIPRGEALGESDITVNNGVFAVAFAVDSAPPWGVARGGIVDIAIVADEEVGYDIASLADFMPNDWSAWPTTYQQVDVEERSEGEVVITTRRDWGDTDLVTTFHIREGDTTIDVVTRMSNDGDRDLDDLLTGYVVWPDGGYLFGVPGMQGIKRGSEENATAHWSAMYDASWVIGLHAPFADFTSQWGRDRLVRHDLQAGETREFSARIQIEASGDLALLVNDEIVSMDAPYGEISGLVATADGRAVDTLAVVAYKNDQPYAWTIGRAGQYSMRLPAGDYGMYATAEGHSQSETIAVDVQDGSALSLDFDDLQSPGKVLFSVQGRRLTFSTQAGGLQHMIKPVDARISIEAGESPLIEYMGKKVFYTELDAVGKANISIAPGQYTFRIAAGDAFTARPEMIEMTVEPGREHAASAAILQEATPSDRGWYSADLHHHSDVLDGYTPPEYVLRAQLAAGVDIAFLSDHDSVVNNPEMRRLAAKRKVLFMPGTELSPSWAHFNAYPLDDGKQVEIDTGTAPVQEVFGEARRLGADIISVNHPYSAYGYFRNLDLPGMVPGGYDDGFDLVEIEPITSENDIERAVKRTWQLWNEGKRAYFAAGSDVHDVWNQVSGDARSYVHVEGELTIDKFVESLRKGRSYASQGPLIFPDLMFGSEVHHELGAPLALEYSVFAVNGLQSVQLIEMGVEVQRSEIVGNRNSSELEFAVHPLSDTWYSLVVTDREGRHAYSNPIWIVIATHRTRP